MPQPAVVVQSEEKRINNFNEVSLGYSKKLTITEAKRCPQCADPVCMKGCPVGIDIPGFIRLLREGNVNGAYQKIKEENVFPSICGRICSAPCEVACVERDSIGIRALERYSADYRSQRQVKNTGNIQKGKKVAIIGSGPTGLTAAAQLAKKGFQVTVFESLDKPGGVLRYGVPEFRIPKKVLDNDIKEIQALGVNIETNFFIGQTATLNDLKEDGFVAVLLAMGAGIPKFMNIRGANLGGVYYGEEFLMRVNLTKSRLFTGHRPNFMIGQKVAVIGSGNTALDCARAARRFKRDVTLVFRRTEDDMRVDEDERRYAKQEGVQFESLVRPMEILGDQNNFVVGLKCIRIDYADSGAKGGWQLEPVPDSEFILDADTVIIAIGHNPNFSLSCVFSENVKLDKDGTIRVDSETSMTSMQGVFASGNVVTNAGPVVEAVAAGKRAAADIDKYLKLL